MDQDNEFFDPGLGVVIRIVEQEDTSAQRRTLQTRAYSAKGRSEGFMARVPARVRPTTIARLRLLAKDPFYGCPLIDEVVDTAIHEYLVSMGY